MSITETEKRVLKSLQLRGVMGNCGSLNEKQRLKLLQGLIDKKLINNNMSLTEKGIELCMI